MADALLLAPLGISAALVSAGALKWRDPGALVDAAADLAVPAPGRLLRILPAVEIALGLAVVLVPGRLAVAPAVAALALMLAYTAIVARAVTAGVDAACGCFGDNEPVGARTVARNVGLVVVAALAVVAALDESPLARLRHLPGGGWQWLVGAGAVGLMVALTMPRDGGLDRSARGIPYLPVVRADGVRTTLPELASLRAQLLVSLSETCGKCAAVTEVIGGWPALAPQVDVRVLSAAPPGTPTPAAWPGVIHDVDGRVSAVIGLAHPSAVLLGADALIAGGPVYGPKAVLAMFEEIRGALDDGGPLSPPSTQPEVDPPR